MASTVNKDVTIETKEQEKKEILKASDTKLISNMKDDVVIDKEKEREEINKDKSTIEIKESKSTKDEDRKRKLNSKEKEKDKTSNADSEDSQITEKKTPLTLSSFFDILGQISIILKTETSLRIPSADYPFNSVPPGELVMSTTESLPVQFKIFEAGDIRLPWIMTDFVKIGRFHDFDEYLIFIWRAVCERIASSQKILLCPSSNIWINRNPNPSLLGYPTDEIMKVNARRNDIIGGIIARINLIDIDATRVEATVCGDPAVLEVSSNLINYSRIEMPVIRNAAQIMMNLQSDNTRSNSILPFNSINTNYNPLFDFRSASFIYYDLPYRVQMAYSMTINAISPSIPIQPLNDSIIIKQAQASATRSGFLPDVIAMQYSSTMSSDFAVIISSLIVPGYFQTYIDWSDTPAEAVELRGFIALLSKALFMRSNGVLDTITDESARAVESAIVVMGVRNNLLRRIPNVDPNAYPLENVEVVARNLGVEILQGMRTDFDGRGWMNGNRITRADDGWDGMYDTPMEHRPVYAVDCSDFYAFLEDENNFLRLWDIYRSLEGFALSWARKNKILSDVIIMYLGNILRFIIRMNEYLRSNYYTGLRLPNDVVNTLIGVVKDRDCLKIPIKAKSILAFVKSVGHDTSYVRTVPFLQQFKVESNIVKTSCYLRAMVRILTTETRMYGVNDEYGRSKRWNMAVSALSSSENDPLLYHLKLLEARKMLGTLPDRYLHQFELNLLYIAIFNPLLGAMARDPAQSGFARTFYYKSTNNSINTKPVLDTLAQTGNILYANVERFQPGPYRRITINGQLRGWMRACEPRYNLDIFSVENFIEVRVPIPIDIAISKSKDSTIPLKFIFPDTDRKFTRTVQISESTFNILKITSDEIRLPDHVVPLAVVPEPLALSTADFRSVVMTVDDFSRRIGEFTQRVVLFRDHSAIFTSMLRELPV